MRDLDAFARYALVVWPNTDERSAPSCIFLTSVEDAVKRGAVVVAREWPTERVTVDPHVNERDCED